VGNKKKLEMEKRYYTSTNFGPWLGIGFVLSSLCFGFVSTGWLLAVLIFLSFLPALAVFFSLKSYFLIENNQIKYCYDRRKGREVDSVCNIVDITQMKRVGKSVAISFDNADAVIKRVYEADVFVEDVMQRNPRIELTA
jgi:hypothetical protein